MGPFAITILVRSLPRHLLGKIEKRQKEPELTRLARLGICKVLGREAFELA